jgi:hypothetical protein
MAAEELSDTISPAQLQLVCAALADAQSAAVTLAGYQAQDRAEGILRDYLRRQVAELPIGERRAAWSALRALVDSHTRRSIRLASALEAELQRQEIGPSSWKPSWRGWSSAAGAAPRRSSHNRHLSWPTITCWLIQVDQELARKAAQRCSTRNRILPVDGSRCQRERLARIEPMPPASA